MKNIFLTLVIVLLSVECYSQTDDQKLDKIFSCTYWNSLISKGDNRPDFSSKKNNIDRFLVSLFYGVPAKDFMKRAGWTPDQLDSTEALLIAKGWIRKDGDKLLPTVFIVAEDKGKELYDYAEPVSKAIAQAIEKSVPEIRKKFELKGFESHYNFDDLSFLILSDVLLDNWQIMNMESAFLKQENRPARHGKFYYAAIMENYENEYEPFRIYGNQSTRINDSTWLGLYGNRRNITNRKLLNSQYRDSVLANSFQLTTELFNYFEEISSDFRPELLRILEEQRNYSMSVFEKSGYAAQIKFEEFFIWWYHFIYTEATNILSDRKIIKIPEDGVFCYR